MSTEYVAAKFAALEEVVAVSAAFQERHNAMARLRLVVTQSKYRKPAITALGIGIFQQLCGFNSLSELYMTSLFGSGRVLTAKCTIQPPCSPSLVSITLLRRV